MDSELEAKYASAARKALEHFPVDANSVDFVDHSENVTYRVNPQDGQTGYVLRLHRPDYNSLSELESEREWVGALVDFGVPVPNPVLTRDGHHFVLIDVPEVSEKRYVGMTTWLEGDPLYRIPAFRSDAAERKRILYRLGEIAAAMHNQATSWSVPPGFTRPLLDLDGLLGAAPRWGRFWEHADLPEGGKECLLAARDRLRGVLADYGQRADNFGLIHADLDSDNIIYHGGELALIDFDDSAYGWHLYDIASALIEYCSDPDFETLCAAFLDGYRGSRSLATQESRMLPTFLLIRGMAIIGWYHDRPEYAASRDFEMVRDWVLGQCKSLRL